MKKPGIVIFVSVLHFFSVAFFAFLSLFCVLALLFGAAWGIDDYFTRQMSQFSPPNFSYGITLIFGAALFVFACFAAFSSRWPSAFFAPKSSPGTCRSLFPRWAS